MYSYNTEPRIDYNDELEMPVMYSFSKNGEVVYRELMSNEIDTSDYTINIDDENNPFSTTHAS